MIMRWTHRCLSFLYAFIAIAWCWVYIRQRLLHFLSLFFPSTQLFSRCTTIYRISSLVFAIVFSLISTPASALDARFFSGNYIEHFDPDAATCSTSSTSSSDGSSGTAAEDLKDFVRKYVKMAVETKSMAHHTKQSLPRGLLNLVMASLGLPSRQIISMVSRLAGTGRVR